VNWAKGIRGVREKYAEILRSQEVEGNTLYTLTKEILTNHPYNLPGGPAASLEVAIEKLISEEGKCKLILHQP
jgi:hypothetical protein